MISANAKIILAGSMIRMPFRPFDDRGWRLSEIQNSGPQRTDKV